MLQTGLVLAILIACALSKDERNYRRIDVKGCREKGFDPFRLVCSTCDLLPAEHHPACKECCQAFMELTSSVRTKPYVSAVLVKSKLDMGYGGFGSSTGSGELDQVIDDKELWDKLVKEKGGSSHLQTMENAVTISRSMSEAVVMKLMRGGAPSEVLLLDEKLPAKLDYKTLKSKAVDSISLNGLSKDDIVDMVTTLLA